MGGAAQDVPAGGQGGDLVAVVHHHRAAGVIAEGGRHVDPHFTELRHGRRRHRAAQLAGQQLGAVADAQNHAAPAQRRQVGIGDRGGAGIADAVVAAGEDRQLGAATGGNRLRHLGGVNDAAAQADLAQLLGDHRRRFRAEVHDQDLGIVPCAPGKTLDAVSVRHGVRPYGLGSVGRRIYFAWHTIATII